VCETRNKVCRRHGVERIEGARHCFSFYVGIRAFELSAIDMMTTFFMAPTFWAAISMPF